MSWDGVDRYRAAEFLGFGADDGQPDAAAGKLIDLKRGCQGVQKDQIQHFAPAQSRHCVGRHDPRFDGPGAHGRLIDAGAVVGDGQLDSLSDPSDLAADSSGLILAGLQPGLRGLDSVRHRVVEDMNQCSHERREHFRIDPHILAIDCLGKS